MILRPLFCFNPGILADGTSPATILAFNGGRQSLVQTAVRRQACAAVIGQYGEDPLATFHLKRLLAGETGDLINVKAA